MHGAASEALAAAYTALRAELASAVLPPGKAASAQVPSPLLAQTLVGAARALLAVARLSTARTLRISAEVPLGSTIQVCLADVGADSGRWMEMHLDRDRKRTSPSISMRQ